LEKIGDFAKRCEVTIKALRYYDKLGLLVPDYIDKFTGYRYYSIKKVAEMQRITELKDIGFTLEEIKLLCGTDSEDKKTQILRGKRQLLENLIAETQRQLQKLSKLEQIEQRGEKKMQDNKNNISMAFENDERVIGRWEAVELVDKKKNFIPPSDSHRKAMNSIIFVDNDDSLDLFFEEVYFLPYGEEYWIFSWTKGFVKISSGDGKLICRYEIEEIDGAVYMFVELHEDIVVLRRMDTKRYTKYEIGQYDDIDLPFVNDEAVIGTWNAVDFVETIENFEPENKIYNWDLYYVTAEFLPDGVLHNHYDNKNDELFMFEQKWTKGTTLFKSGDGTTAPAYEIRNFSGTDYLFIEWKSGDYIWGKRKPSYYVFKRGEI